MKNNDMTRDLIRQKMAAAMAEENTEKFSEAFDEMTDAIAEQVRGAMQAELDGIRDSHDAMALQTRGERILTSEEEKYFTELAKAMRDENPKQALSGLNLTLPITTVESVFEDLRERHPLLSKIDFVNAGPVLKVVMNTGSRQEAAWGELCDSIVKEVTEGFKVVDVTAMKLSAFALVCKEALELGARWLERFVREVLYEYIANGLEKAIVTGTGNKEPIGMDRDVSDDVTVVAGVYPKKEAVEVTTFDMQTMGNLFGILSINPRGGTREIGEAILVVNLAEYYTKIMPAISVLAPDGGYRTVLPFVKPENIIPSAYVAQGEAILGIPRRYFAALATPKNGRIEYDDSAKFIEDKRAYIIKLYGNGMPKDNNAFLRLDISGLVPVQFEFVSVDARTKDDTDTLSTLYISGVTLSPAFDPDEDTYTATTTGTKSTVFALPTNAAETMTIKLGTTVIANGAEVTWATGSNVITVTTLAENGTDTETYTVTVTKS